MFNECNINSIFMFATVIKIEEEYFWKIWIINKIHGSMQTIIILRN